MSLADAISQLSPTFTGQLLQRNDVGYDDARRVHNGLIDKRPALIARCHGTADVVDAVKLARTLGLEIAVRGGGHNVAGRATVHDGLMIDLASMKGIHVDPGQRTARAQGGVLWKELNRETQVHGLATTGGVVGTTGIAGLTLAAGLLTAPDGSNAKLAGVLACHCGSLAAGEKAVQPIKAFGPPIVDQMGPISYCTQNGLLDAALPKGALNYWKAHFLTDLSDDAIATLVACFEKCTSPMSQIVLEHFHGAASRVPVTDTACAMRITGFNVVLISQWSDPREGDRHIAWCRETYDALRPYLGSFRYVNYLAEDEVGDPVAAAYGPNYQRLRALKAKYDPENFFHINANITPLHA